MTNTTPALGTIVTNTKARATIYAVYGIVALIAAAVTVGFAAAGDIPQWDSVVNAVVSFLGAPVGGLAVANIQKS